MISQEKATGHNNSRPLVTWEILFCHISPEQYVEKKCFTDIKLLQVYHE